MIQYRAMVPGFKQLCAAYDRAVNEAQLTLYATMVGRVVDDLAEWGWIVQQAITTLKFWPSIAELIQLHRDYQRLAVLGPNGASVELAAATEWVKATECVHHAGAFGPKRFDRQMLESRLTPLGMEAAVIAQVPGMAESDIGYNRTRRRFVEAYLALDRQRAKPVRALPGGTTDSPERTLPRQRGSAANISFRRGL